MSEPPAVVDALVVTPMRRRHLTGVLAIEAQVYPRPWSARLFEDELERRGRADDTIVVLFSDHGESLGEDPRLPDHHGLVVYQALTHVPVAVRVPGVAPRALPAPMSLVDLPPTVLGLLGVSDGGGMAPLDGVDLSDDVLGAPLELIARDRTLVMNEQDQWAVVAWPYKLLVRPADNLTELYDLAADPDERHDLAARLRARVKELRDGHLTAMKMAASEVSERMTMWMVVPSLVFGLFFLVPPLLTLVSSG